MKYFDFASATPVANEVQQAMQPYWSEKFMNPASKTDASKKLVEEIEVAKCIIGTKLNLDPKGFIVTSGASESINTIIQGVVDFYGPKSQSPIHLITSVAEHSTTLGVHQFLEKKGIKVSYVPLNSDGLIDLKQFENMIQSNSLLASFHHINNETGIHQPVEAIQRICQKQGMLLNLDCAQSIGKHDFKNYPIKADYISFCAHKAQGPLGVGLIHVSQKPLRHLVPLHHGKGIQLRAGTFPTALFIGMSKAIELTNSKQLDYVAELRRSFLKRLNPRIILNVSKENSVPHIINLHCPHVFNDILFNELNEYHFSAGSACTSHEDNPSHVLKSLGFSNNHINCSIRVSLHHTLKIKDVLDFADAINTVYDLTTCFLPEVKNAD